MARFDVLDALYEIWHKLPPCALMGVIGNAIQEIQYYRDKDDL